MGRFPALRFPQAGKGTNGMGAHELSSLLWKERELLDVLTYKLETEQLLLTSGKTRWLQYATGEVEAVIEQLRMAGLARAVAVASVGHLWGVEENASLSEIAEAAPAGPWGDIMKAHLAAMFVQTRVIRALRDSNEQFLRAAARSAQETLSSVLPEAAGTYTAQGRSSQPARAARLFDTTL